MKHIAMVILAAALIAPFVSDILKSVGLADIFSSEFNPKADQPLVKKRFGILSLPLTDNIKTHLREKLIAKGTSKHDIESILANLSQYYFTYLRYLKEVGLDAEPIYFNDTNEAILHQMSKLDGVLLTGGDTLYELYKMEDRVEAEYYKVNRQAENEYLMKIRMMLNRAKEINDSGRSFEIYGICLGLQGIILTESDWDIPVAYVNRNNIMDGVLLYDQSAAHRHDLTEDEIQILHDANFMFYYHNYGFSVEDFKADPRLHDNYTIDAIYKVKGHGDCVGMIKHKKYPFTAVQFHPEKMLYEESKHFQIASNYLAKKLIYKLSTVLNKGHFSYTEGNFLWNNNYDDYAVDRLRQLGKVNEVLMEDIAVYRYLMLVGNDKVHFDHLLTERAN